MLILPVLDMLNGQVVRGVAGRRQTYRPIVSQLTSSVEPVAVGRAFHDILGLHEVYVADLDALAGAPPLLDTYAALRALGLRIWVDAGVRDLRQAQQLAGNVDTLVVGLETVTGPLELQRIAAELCSERVVFSLDLKEGRPLGDVAVWRQPDAWSIAQEAIALGITRLLVLDLAHVGMNAGVGTDALCMGLGRDYPKVEVAAGGGVRDRSDVERLKGLGVRVILVASALHDGRLSRADCQEFG
jgi:phosphoribosylformimino-5-aminoimidazole carboxamide ribotide isomerase